MKKIIALVVLSVLAFPMVSWGDYFDDAAAHEAKTAKDNAYAASVKKVDVSKYSLTELEIKKSLLNALFARGWEINKHTRYKILAQYKDTVMLISIDGSKVEFRETSEPHKSDYGWITAAANKFMLEAEYYYEMDQAEKMINDGAE